MLEAVLLVLEVAQEEEESEPVFEDVEQEAAVSELEAELGVLSVADSESLEVYVLHEVLGLLCRFEGVCGLFSSLIASPVKPNNT